MLAIDVRGVEKRYVGRGRETAALEPIDLAIDEGEFVAFVGPSGCGKSTLMNMVAGIIAPSAGSILHEGRAVSGINRNVGYMTQTDSVLPWRTVEQNVGLALEYRGVPAAERGERVRRMLALVGLEGFGRAFP
jgi:NitT/TauT family transport system ATP-binding protein